MAVNRLRALRADGAVLDGAVLDDFRPAPRRGRISANLRVRPGRYSQEAQLASLDRCRRRIAARTIAHAVVHRGVEVKSLSKGDGVTFPKKGDTVSIVRLTTTRS